MGQGLPMFGVQPSHAQGGRYTINGYLATRGNVYQQTAIKRGKFKGITPLLPLLFPVKNQVVTKNGNTGSLANSASSRTVSVVTTVSTNFALDTRKGL